jgi:hypothetical protein
MIQSYESTPQIFITGSIQKAFGFNSNEMYIRYIFIYGDNHFLISGCDKGETFQNKSSPIEEYTPFDHPLNLHLKCRSVKGWPKLLLEVWSTDSHNRNNMVGYGMTTVPFKSGFERMEVSCWRPKGNEIKTYITGITSEIEDKSIIFSCEEKFGFEVMTTGVVIVQLDVILKDFEIHGIE